MIGLTAKQAELLNYIRDRAAQAQCPSFIEMQMAMGLRSKSGVHRLLAALEERGYVRRLPNRARALELCDPAVDLSGVSDGDLWAEVQRRRAERLAA